LTILAPSCTSGPENTHTKFNELIQSYIYLFYLFIFSLFIFISIYLKQGFFHRSAINIEFFKFKKGYNYIKIHVNCGFKAFPLVVLQIPTCMQNINQSVTPALGSVK
jgi:hypothetical protein